MFLPFDEYEMLTRLCCVQGLESGDVPEDVALHGVQHAQHLCQLVRAGSGICPQRQLRFPWRVHHASLLSAAKLQLDHDRGPVGLQGIRNCFHTR